MKASAQASPVRERSKRPSGILSLSVASALLVLAGCLPTCIHPLYAEKDLVFDPNLIGNWLDADDGSSWRFKAGEESAYELTLTDGNGDRGLFEAHLLELDGHRFLDFTPAEESLEAAIENGAYRFLVVRAHTFMRVDCIGPRLALATLDWDWFTERLKDQPDLLPHHPLEDDRLLIVASTEQLQQFVRTHLHSEDAWETLELERAPHSTHGTPSKK